MSTQVQRLGVTTFLAKAADFRAYREAETLAEWLNLRKEELRPHQKTARRAIEIIREINSRTRKEAGLRELNAELIRLIEPLKRLRWRPMKNKAGRWYLDQTWQDDSNYGLFLVARLSEHGLDWVRQCPCGTWFVAHNRRNRFHSGECKLRFEKQSHKTPEWRARRAAYMRQLRAGKEAKRRGAVRAKWDRRQSRRKQSRKGKRQ